MPSIEDIKKNKELLKNIEKKKYDFDIPPKEDFAIESTTPVVEVKPVTKTTSKSTEKIRVNRNTHDDYIRRSYTLSEEHVRKLQLMKTFCDDTNITYNELIEKSIDLLWKHEYQDKYIQLLKTIG